MNVMLWLTYALDEEAGRADEMRDCCVGAARDFIEPGAEPAAAPGMFALHRGTRRHPESLFLTDHLFPICFEESP